MSQNIVEASPERKLAAPGSPNYTALRIVGADTSLDAIAERIRARIRRTTIDIIATGRDLVSVKAQLGHGGFLKWIDAEFGMSDRTAQRYIAASEFVGTKSDTVSDLPPATLYRLAAPTTPQPIKARVLADLESGRKVDAKAVDEEIRLAIWQEKHSRPLSELNAERRRKKAGRRGKLTPEVERRIARQQENEAQQEHQRQRERDQAKAEVAAILAKLPAVDLDRLCKINELHGYIVTAVLLDRKAVAE